ncbi:peptidoglycan peptidase [Paracoccus sp. (in: a-proteobacteria)]|uniref:peptidoglycan peptidase n=1 Tax=Paracoccus sp. TaxID=267 RepID=UPI0028A90F99|nr:peptidoglycan peptidase [Paracoccus sp. (in: a-proteobacteria)]
MNMKRTIFAAAAVLTFGLPTWAQEDDSLAGPELGQPGSYEAMKEAEWDWHPGDLIFRNGVNDLDELIRHAEAGRWATVGMLRSSSGGPRVVYVDQSDGVTEVMLYEFVDGLSDRDYEVYRIESLDPNVPGEQMEQGPTPRFALFIAYGAAYDSLMLLGNDGYYNAELPYVAALNFGVILGVPTPLEKLVTQSQMLRDALLLNWEAHPFCVVAASQEECWNEIKEISVVTTGQIISSDAVTRVFPN